MANTCQLPLLTPTGREVLAGCVNWQFGFDVRQSWTIRAVLHKPHAGLHRMCTEAQCFRVAGMDGSVQSLITNFFDSYIDDTLNY
jgi:hypothetical protein